MSDLFAGFGSNGGPNGNQNVSQQQDDVLTSLLQKHQLNQALMQHQLEQQNLRSFGNSSSLFLNKVCALAMWTFVVLFFLCFMFLLCCLYFRMKGSLWTSWCQTQETIHKPKDLCPFLWANTVNQRLALDLVIPQFHLDLLHHLLRVANHVPRVLNLPAALVAPCNLVFIRPRRHPVVPFAELLSFGMWILFDGSLFVSHFSLVCNL